jgi:CDP-4-dehydro-6-deoxyglucose reductase
MDKYLNVATAARLAGVSRSSIQKKIKKGELSTFEGKVYVCDLLDVYPELKLEDTAVLERMSRIQLNAVNKGIPNKLPKEHQMAAELNRLRTELADARAEIRRFHELVMSLKQRLMDIQEEDDCSRKQKLVLQALIGWMLRKIDQQG